MSIMGNPPIKTFGCPVTRAPMEGGRPGGTHGSRKSHRRRHRRIILDRGLGCVGHHAGQSGDHAQSFDGFQSGARSSGIHSAALTLHASNAHVAQPGRAMAADEHIG